MRLYYVLACAVLAIHALFIAWVIFGAAFTRRRPLLRRLHIGSLLWGVLIEVAPWPCPLTVLEQWLEIRAGLASYQGGFLLHYLDALVYPNVDPVLLTYAAVAVAIVNFGIYVRRLRRA
jgi:prolipoprotein diacylglyceryltransferase